MQLYLTYDGRGFADAKQGAEIVDLQTQKEYDEVLAYLIDWAMHDFNKGFCESFQVYNELGEVVFEKKQSEVT